MRILEKRLNKSKKIGVIAGVFDPIHLGHISLVNKIISDKNLDEVILLIEKSPLHKKTFANYSDRRAMLDMAIKNHPKISVYDCTHESYPITNCLPEIKSNRQGNIYLIVGHDVAEHMQSWDGIDSILNEITVVTEPRIGGITSGKIRESLAGGEAVNDSLDTFVYDYIKAQKLYQ